MNETKSKEAYDSEVESQPGEECKPDWQTPELVLLGRLADLVQGGGKSGYVSDSDPGMTQKKGVG